MDLKDLGFKIVLTLFGLCLLWLFLMVMPVLSNDPDLSSPPQYFWTCLNGQGWAMDKIKSDQYFIDISDPDTLTYNRTINPGCAHVPFCYMFTFIDKNGTAHRAEVNIQQDGNWIGGPWYDNDTFFE